MGSTRATAQLSTLLCPQKAGAPPGVLRSRSSHLTRCQGARMRLSPSRQPSSTSSNWSLLLSAQQEGRLSC
jgi:hypothetical protein